MAIVSTSIMTVKPGQWDEFKEHHAKAIELLKKSGAKNVRLLASLSGGTTGEVATTWEADDFRTYGEVVHTFFTSGGDQLMMEGYTSSDSPMISSTSNVWADIPDA